MNKAVLLKAGGRVFGIDVLFQVDADVIRLALLVHGLLRNQGSRLVFFMTGHMIPGVGMLVNLPDRAFDKTVSVSRILPSGQKAENQYKGR